MIRLWVHCAVAAALSASWLMGGCSHVSPPPDADGDTDRNGDSRIDAESGSPFASGESIATNASEGAADAADPSQSASPQSTPPELDTVLWTFGNDLMTAESGLVADKAGNIYAAISTRHYTSEGQVSGIDEIRLVSLDPNGRECWRSDPICPQDPQIIYGRFRNVYVAVADDAVYAEANCGTLEKFDLAWQPAVECVESIFCQSRDSHRCRRHSLRSLRQ